jgi:hypothetical protein
LGLSGQVPICIDKFIFKYIIRNICLQNMYFIIQIRTGLITFLAII